MTGKPLYRRVLLKASGEALMGEQHFGIDVSVVDRIAADIAEARALGVEVGVVIGGGNIFRGVAVASKGGDRVTGDQWGCWPVINSAGSANLAHQARRRCRGAVGLAMPELCESFRSARPRLHEEAGGDFAAARHLLHHRFAAALRAAEIGADALFKGSRSTGVIRPIENGHFGERSTA